MAFTLNQPIGTNYPADPDDIMNTKRALNRLGYYKIPAHRGIDDWTDDAMFDGIRSFQKANGLKVDAFMRPGGPTEAALKEGLGEGETPSPNDSKGGPREPGDGGMVIKPPPTDPNMPEIKKYPGRYPAGPYMDKNGNIIIEGIDPRTGFPIPPHKGPY